MNLIISFSGREGGNCDHISEYIATEGDTIIHFRNLHVHDCSGCRYECFETWFEGTKWNHRVLGIERHKYGQKMEDKILGVKEIKQQIDQFIWQ